MRLKLMAGNMVVLLLVGLASYLLVKGQLDGKLAAEIDGRINADAQLLSQSLTLAGTELTQYVQNRAQTSGVRQALVAVGEKEQRQRAHSAAQDVAAWFGNSARRSEKPDIVAVLDETGRVIARDTDPNRMFGRSLMKELPTLRSVIEKGVALYDVWSRDGKLLQVGLAPVRTAQGGMLGALLVGYDLSNGFAKREAARLGRDVMFLSDSGVYSTSTSVGVKDGLQALLFGKLEGATRQALDGKTSSPWTAEVAGDEYVGVTGSLSNVSSLKAAFAVVANKTKHMSMSSVVNAIPILTLLGLLGLGVYGSIVANSLIKPLEQIEEDILGVINGQTNRRVEVQSDEFGGLAYRINQLINLFTGVAEEDDEGRAVISSGVWAAAQMQTTPDQQDPTMEAGDSPDPASDPDADRLAAEPEGAYFARLYNEYVAAKQAAGEDVSNVTQDRFIQRLKGNEGHLLKRHGARMIRFKVVTKGGQVDLQPVIIK